MTPVAKKTPEVIAQDFKIINKGSLRAFCSVTIGGLKIHGCRIIQQDGQAGWVSLPQTEWTAKDGKKRYSPVIEVPEHIKAAIQAVVLDAWQRLTP